MVQFKLAPASKRFTLLFCILLLVFSQKFYQCDGKEDEHGLEAIVKASSDSPYSCEWSYLQIQDLSLIGYSINHLSLIDRDNETEVQEISESFTEGYGSIEAKNFALTEISLNVSVDELRASRLNPKLPFIFFINGFNTFNQEGEVNGTWMYDVAKTYARRGLQNRRHKKDPEIGANIIFLTWGIPEIFAESVLAMIPAYYKTMANYDVILDFVSETISKIIQFVEDSHELDGGWPSEEARAEYYSGFQFLGHSLGSHIITDAVNRVRKTFRNQLRFGKLTGLDPAMPCFLSLGHGISKEKLTNSTVELVILHSNAGLAGLTSERANVEIVLNGGTFQPGCAWYDFGCHHARSTDIFGYMDDRCQLVAYKCSSYHHFKSGACETCDFDPTQLRPKQSDTYGKNCVLVNMPEQHVDTNETLAFVEQMGADEIRQLADEDEEFDLSLFDGRSSPGSQWSASNTIRKSIHSRGVDANKQLGQQNHKRLYYHYVNTSPNFRSGRKTHCLQHYQVRLIVLQHPKEGKQIECPLSSFYKTRGDSIQLKLYHDDSLLSQQAGGIGWARYNWINKNRTMRHQTVAERTLRSSPDIRLDKIIKDNLYTSLLNFEGSPELFVGAEIVNIDLEKLNNCLTGQNVSTRQMTSLVLDIAFMSHTNRKFRHAFSSILCGNISSIREQKITNQQNKDRLLLRLCKQSELSTVSGQIDKLLDQIEQQRLNESWRVSLLNSLFSLFAEWEPF